MILVKKIQLINRLKQSKSSAIMSPMITLAIVALAVFFTTIVFSRRTFYVFPDNIDQFFAWYQKLAVSLHHGFLPLWDANTSAGHSFVGELQQGVFYPINLLWVWLFGSVNGISIYFLELIVVFHFWLASLGMYYAVRSTGISKYASLAAGIAYAYGGTVAVRSVSQTAIFFGLCYIPWVFFGFNTWLGTKQRRYLILSGLAAGFIILAGHIQPWYHSMLLITFLAIFQNPNPAFDSVIKTTFNRLIQVAKVLAISLIVALPQIFVSAQYLPQAYRFVGDSRPIGPSERVSIGTFTKTFSYPPEGFLSLLNPTKYTVVDGNELYIGLIGLVLMIFLVTAGREKLKKHAVWQRYKLFIIGTSALSFIVMIGYLTFIPAIIRYIPLVSQIRQLARYSILIHFCMCLLVGIGIEVLANYLKDLPQSKKRRLVITLGFMAAAAFMTLNSIYLYKVAGRGVVSKHFVYQNAIVAIALLLCGLFRTKTKEVILFAFILSAVVQPTWFLPKISDHPITYAPTYYRRTSSITFLENYYSKSRVLIQNNALPVNIGDVYKIQTVNGYGATLQKPFFDFINEPEDASNSGIHMDLLNVQFLVDSSEHPELKLRLYDSERNIYVYERPNYLPRIYYASQADSCRQGMASCINIEATQYSERDIKFTTNSVKPDGVIISEVYFEGWKAKLDGKPIEVKAYNPTSAKLFRKVDVPAGSHSVELYYSPFPF